MVDLQLGDLELRRREVRNQQLRLAATIVERADGGPMRPVGRRRGHRPGGLYYSAKMGRHIGWESKVERDAFYCVEVSPEVVSYREQPHTAVAMIDGVKRSYTPDRVDMLADGTVAVVEIKETFEAAADPDYTRKLRYFADVYQSLGWRFEVVEREAIAGELCFDAVKKIQSHRRVSFNALELNAVLGEMQLGQTTLGRLQASFPNPLVGQAKLFAMMVDRHIQIDLRGPLSEASLVGRVDAA